MTSKRKRHAQKIIDSLKDPAPLSDNKGRFIREHTRSYSEKDRRRDGWSTPKIACPEMKWDEVKSEALLPEDEYDPWETYEDGLGYGKYESEKIMRPEKVMKQKQIRKARKDKKEEGRTK